MKKQTDFVAEAESVMKSQKAALDDLAQARAAEFSARTTFEDAKEKLSSMTRAKIIEYHNNPRFAGLKDPVIGDPSKEWTELVIEQAMQQDKELIAAVGEYYQAQRALGDVQTALQIIIDRIGTMQGWSRLLASLIDQMEGE